MSDRQEIARLYAREAMARTARALALLRFRWARLFVRAPDRLIVAPTDLRAADPFVAEEIHQGRFPLGGRVLATNGLSPFALELPSREFANRLHSFGWLRHVRASHNETYAATARRIIDDWIGLHGRLIVGIAWDPDIVAQRVLAWLSHSTIVLRGADIGFYRRYLRSLAIQVRYLQAMAGHAEDGEVRLRLRIVLAFASLAMPASAARIRRAARALDRELDSQILPDGGHVSRNPRVGLELLIDLLPLRQTYVNLGYDVPLRLIPAIDRMFPALRFFRHQNGELALFNGATSTLANELVSVLRYDETGGAPFRLLPHMNYHRLAARDMVIIMDTGTALGLSTSTHAHAGCLSFEMSSGRNRFIINSGAPRFAGETYRQLARSTAAHSTAVVNDTSSARILRRRFLPPYLVGGPVQVDVQRQDLSEGADGLIASHDGYLEAFGLIHERAIGVTGQGSFIRGRDRFRLADGSDPSEADSNRAVLRFHIHPQIEIREIDAREIELVAPDGERWSFTTLDTDMAVEDDVFFADPSGIRPSRQVTMTFRIGEIPEVQWVLQKKA